VQFVIIFFFPEDSRRGLSEEEIFTRPSNGLLKLRNAHAYCKDAEHSSSVLVFQSVLPAYAIYWHYLSGRGGKEEKLDITGKGRRMKITTIRTIGTVSPRNVIAVELQLFDVM
jgi:hypothetical protein